MMYCSTRTCHGDLGVVLARLVWDFDFEAKLPLFFLLVPPTEVPGLRPSLKLLGPPLSAA